MTEASRSPEFLTSNDGTRLAWRRLEGHTPGVVFLGGYKSDMTGTKATELEDHCRQRGQAFLRFDYSGHGESGGEFETGTIGHWTEDALQMIDQLTEGPQILVGSSMGGWVMLLAALARAERVAGLVGIAAAPDFTEDLMWEQLTPELRQEVMDKGRIEVPSEYAESSYIITRDLIEDGRQRLLLRKPLEISCPVRLLHGMADHDVPYRTAIRLAETLTTQDVEIKLVKDADHRFSTERDLGHLKATLDALIARIG
ncbi:alpha/beta hydrolase [Fodinicurvata halophila]|uniref:Alpha/beta hydrolase n=1 Tax=Fodinicurvata halophila TaxID=1419723 RepID=A0ABV8UKN7_9PROT